MIKLFRFLATIGLLGAIIGMLGLLLTWFLFEIQHVAFGYSIDHIYISKNYLQVVKNVSPQ